ncbi:uncharacterized protein LOC6535561 [Drosophila yakuba]|uniref:Corona n=2 Tax=Drosophila yakuba TaxID=7245 RepID=B4PLC0_DROYA|nr:uncharacterized protein LOC6535561 [Drosophila yakuba]EDW95902.2 uncharacterized protein Dyak_GE25535 [Drosophila yakuba]
MASNPDENNKDPKSEVPPGKDDQMTAYVEKYVTRMCYGNDLRTTLTVEKNKKVDVLIAKKYTALNYLTHVDNPQNLVANLQFLHSRNANMLKGLYQVVNAKRNAFQAYDVYCKKVLRVKADMQKQRKCFDEFTGMNYHDLKKIILNSTIEVQEIREKTDLKSVELKKKRELIKASQKSMNNDIRVLSQIERDAMEIIEDLKSKISAMQVQQKANNI